MKIPINIIAQALMHFQPQIELSSEDATYSKLRFIQDTSYSEDTLYVGYGNDIQRNALNCGIVSLGETSASVGNLIIIPDHCNLQEVYTVLQELFDQFSDYSMKLYRALNYGTYQDLIEVAQNFLTNPVFFIDSSYRVMAFAPNVAIPLDSEWDHIRFNGFISFEAIKKLKLSGGLEEQDKYMGPTIYSSLIFPHRSIISNINIEKIFAGRLIILEAFKTVDPQDLLSAQMLSEALQLKMSQDESFQYLLGKGPVYSMMLDLVCGKTIDKELLADRMHYLPQWTRGFFRVLFVPLDSSNSHAFEYYANHLSKSINCYSVFYENSLISVLHYSKQVDFQKIGISITEFLSKNGLKGGLSNELESLLELHDYYKQAVVSLRLGDRNKVWSLYQEHMLDHILSFCSQEKIPLLAHESVLRLRQFDKKNDTEFYKTLRIFLENERSLVKTAHALYIHRNTLVHRINKIGKIISADLDDPETRLHILISYKLLEG